MVREQSDYAGCAAAEAAGLPYAAVEVLARGRSLEMVAMFAEGLDAIRAAVGLAPDPGHAMLTRHLVLSPFPPSFRSPDAAAPPTLRFVRPAPFDRSGAEALPGWVAGLPEDRAVVYATLGTTSNFRPDVFEAIITELRDEPLSLIAEGAPDSAIPGLAAWSALALHSAGHVTIALALTRYLLALHPTTEARARGRAGAAPQVRICHDRIDGFPTTKTS